MIDTILARSPAARRVQNAAAAALFAGGVTADRATLGGAAAGVAAGLCLLAGAQLAGILLLLASAALDALDGTIAREHQAPSAAGGIMDLTCDRVVEVAVLAGVAWNRPELYFPALLLGLSWYLNITVFLAVGAALERKGPKLIEYPPGILERGEAIGFFLVLITLRVLGPILCYIFTVLELITAVQRLMFGLRGVK